jgi:hypothetical protein
MTTALERKTTDNISTIVVGLAGLGSGKAIADEESPFFHKTIGS